jgi:hypothetical protein
MTPDRKKPGVAFWATVLVVVVLAGYPLSFGPACWISERTGIPSPVIATIYRPVTWAMNSGSLPRWIDQPYRKYFLWWTDRGE